jgi:hypothetical protein
MTSKALERLDIGICWTRTLAQMLRIAKGTMGAPMALVDQRVRWRLTSKDVPFQMLVSGKGLTTVGAEDHFGNMAQDGDWTKKRLDKEDGCGQWMTDERVRLYGERYPDVAVGGGSWRRDRGEPHVNGEKVMSVVAASQLEWMWLGCRGLRRRQDGL